MAPPNCRPRAWRGAMERGRRPCVRSIGGGLCRYAAENRGLPPATLGRVVFFGDSITEFWKDYVPDMFSDTVLNRGISGQTTPQMLVRFRQDVLALKPAVVHILAGTNDIAGNTGPTTVARLTDNLETMAELARAHGIRVILGTILPAKRYPWRPEIDPVPAISKANKWIRTYAAREGLGLADYHAVMGDAHDGLPSYLAPDGVHPNKAGYEIMGPLAFAALLGAKPSR